MKLLVVGGSRGTGKLAVEEALARGHEVTVLARTPQTLGTRTIVGNALDAAAVSEAMRGQDAVLITLGASPSAMRKPLTLYSESTRVAIEAMKAHDVRRLVVLSAHGAGESAQLMNPVVRAIARRVVLRHNYDDHERQEQLAIESGLEWVIARPARLTNGKAKRQFVAEPGLRPVPGSISRADTAVFLVDAADTDRWVRQTVLLGG
jgi:uncharacterized protein YbjT (DUF2867 family)